MENKPQGIKGVTYHVNDLNHCWAEDGQNRLITTSEGLLRAESQKVNGENLAIFETRPCHAGHVDFLFTSTLPTALAANHGQSPRRPLTDEVTSCWIMEYRARLLWSFYPHPFGWRCPEGLRLYVRAMYSALRRGELGRRFWFEPGISRHCFTTSVPCRREMKGTASFRWWRPSWALSFRQQPNQPSPTDRFGGFGRKIGKVKDWSMAVA